MIKAAHVIVRHYIPASILNKYFERTKIFLFSSDVYVYLLFVAKTHNNLSVTHFQKFYTVNSKWIFSL